MHCCCRFLKDISFLPAAAELQRRSSSCPFLQFLQPTSHFALNRVIAPCSMHQLTISLVSGWIILIGESTPCLEKSLSQEVPFLKKSPSQKSPILKKSPYTESPLFPCRQIPYPPQVQLGPNLVFIGSKSRSGELTCRLHISKQQTFHNSPHRRSGWEFTEWRPSRLGGRCHT